MQISRKHPAFVFVALLARKECPLDRGILTRFGAVDHKGQREAGPPEGKEMKQEALYAFGTISRPCARINFSNSHYSGSRYKADFIPAGNAPRPRHRVYKT